MSICLPLGGCKDRAGTTTPPAHPTTQQALNGPAERGYSPDGCLEFNSRLALEVDYCDDTSAIRVAGKTPATQPVKIPQCQWWAVRPEAGVRWADLLAEAAAKRIPGLMLEQGRNEDLANLPGWPNIEILRIHTTQTLFAKDSPINDTGLAVLSRLGRLRWLDIGSSEVSDAGLGHLKDLHSLEHLDLTGTKISDAGLLHLTGLMNLQSLGLSFTSVGDAALETVAKLVELRELGLMQTKITDVGLSQLASLKLLKKLDISRTVVSDAGMEQLKGLKSLEVLKIEKTGITDAGLAAVAELKGLKVLSAGDDKITDAGLEIIGDPDGAGGAGP